jgi:hypothetical protein
MTVKTLVTVPLLVATILTSGCVSLTYSQYKKEKTMSSKETGHETKGFVVKLMPVQDRVSGWTAS